MGTIVRAQGYTTLGIGISSPEGTLHVHSATPYFPPNTPPISPDGEGDGEGDRFLQNYRTIFHVTNYNTGTGEEDGFSVTQFDNDVTLRQYEDGDFTLQNHNASLILSSGGKVGVGAVSSSHTFNVTGTARVTGTLTAGNATINNSLTAASLHATTLLDAPNAIIGATLRVGSGFYCDYGGALKVKSLRVTTTDWPDYVFGGGYRLMPLSEVEQYIGAQGHLPAIPSAQEMEENGIDVGEMNKLLLQKVEELTLYVIDLQKQVNELKSNK